MIIAPIQHRTNFRFKNMNDFESYINAIDVNCDSEDVTFTDYIYKLNTPQFKVVKEVLTVKVLNICKKLLNIMCKTVIYQLQECVLSNVLTILIYKKEYTEEFSTFIRNEQRRFNVMTSAGIQPFRRKYNIKIGCFDGTRINPRNITQRDTSLFIYNNHICLIWKSNNISFNHVIEYELKPNFKFVENVISDKHVRIFIKYDFKPKI